MEAWDLLEDTKWKIMKTVSHGPVSMAEIAGKVGTTIANISQHLKLLEAYGYVQKEKEKREGPGKPTNLYTLKKDFALVAIASPGNASRKVLSGTDPMQRVLVNLAVLKDKNARNMICKVLWDNEKMLELCDAISLLSSSDEKIELLLMTDNLEEVRKKYSNFKIKRKGKEVEIACWTHSEKEIQDGLDANDDYYNKLTSKFRIIHDPKNIMKRWM